MIIVHCPLKQDFIIELLKEPIDNIVYQFIRKEGIRIYFEVTASRIEEAITFAKAKIKQTDIGNILYFQITGE